MHVCGQGRGAEGEGGEQVIYFFHLFPSTSRWNRWNAFPSDDFRSPGFVPFSFMFRWINGAEIRVACCLGLPVPLVSYKRAFHRRKTNICTNTNLIWILFYSSHLNFLLLLICPIRFGADQSDQIDWKRVPLLQYRKILLLICVITVLRFLWANKPCALDPQHI